MKHCLLCQACCPPGRYACLNCFVKILNHRWQGCSRCGHSLCAGCGRLKEFKTVQSLFGLNSIWASLLLDAKDRNEIISQVLLRELFAAPLKREVLNLLRSHAIRTLVISPLRGNRLLTAQWHPALLFDHIAQQIVKMPEFSHLKIYSPWSLNSTRQASISSAERIRNVETHEENEDLRGKEDFVELYDEESMQNNEINEALFLDDVLTSGESALHCKKSLQKSFLFTQWHILTLFRTPISNKP